MAPHRQNHDPLLGVFVVGRGFRIFSGRAGFVKVWEITPKRVLNTNEKMTGWYLQLGKSCGSVLGGYFRVRIGKIGLKTYQR